MYILFYNLLYLLDMDKQPTFATSNKAVQQPFWELLIPQNNPESQTVKRSLAEKAYLRYQINQFLISEIERLKNQIKEGSALVIKNSEGEEVGLCYLEPIADYEICELKIISTSSSDLVANLDEIYDWLRPNETPLVAKLKSDDEDYSYLIGGLALVVDRIGEESPRFKGMTGNLLASKDVYSYKSNKNLIYEQIFLPRIEEIKKELVGYENSEVGFRIIRSGLEKENRFAIEIRQSGSLSRLQKVMLEDLLRFYYNQLPESRFGREFTILNDYTIKLSNLLDILENK